MSSSQASVQADGSLEDHLTRSSAERGWRSWLSIPKDRFSGPWSTLVLVVLAWAACSFVRYQYISWADQVPEFKWEGVVQPTTHDAFTHGAMIEQHVRGAHAENPNIFPLFNSQGALHVLSWAVMKTTSVKIGELMLWAPVFLGSLMAVPLVLLGRVFGSSLWGFTAALIGGIAFNYYERSMGGYFDTDLFSFWISMLIVFFLIGANQKKSIIYAGMGSITIFLYPFFYAKGLVIGSSIAGCFVIIQLLYMLFKKDVEIRVRMIIPVIVAAASSPWSHGSRINESPFLWLLGLLLVVASWIIVSGVRIRGRSLYGLLGLSFLWLVLNLPWPYFIGQVQTYSHMFGSSDAVVEQVDPEAIRVQAIKNEIDFRRTHKFTIKESQGEQWSLLAQRISGSVTGSILALFGYILLCLRYPAFLVALPLAAIGLFSFDGGLRFTTWGGVIAAPALVYILFLAVQTVLRLIPRLDIRAMRFGSVVGGMLLATPFIAVNYAHALSFKVAPVFTKSGIVAMNDIQEVSSPGDYVICWWDYGSGIWYYSGCNVLMTPISASNDCWTVATCLTSDSQEVAAVLSMLTVDAAGRGKRPAANEILGLNGDDPISPTQLIDAIESNTIDIPEIDQDVFLYMPNEMIPLMGVIEAYANAEYTLPMDPRSGTYFYFAPGTFRSLGNGRVQFTNNLILDTNTLETFIPAGADTAMPVQFKSIHYVSENSNEPGSVQEFIPTNRGVPRMLGSGGGGQMMPAMYEDGVPEGHHELHLVILADSGSVIIMSENHFNSNTTQMALLQKYDRSLWELVHKSSQARVFKLKKDGLNPTSNNQPE